jgi:structural maintenance of chromosome 1
VQDRAKKKMEFDNQINRITTQLEYERKREDQLRTNTEKFKRTVQDDEDALETAKKVEQTQVNNFKMLLFLETPFYTNK